MDDNNFFWLGDPHNRYMTTEEYNAAVLAFRASNDDNEGPSDVDGVLRTVSRSVRKENIDVV